ncbi:MAG: sulfotransferase [Rhodobacteraceae bacterium]|nr:sulfotransferase [Paracoccaceae bacterium]
MLRDGSVLPDFIVIGAMKSGTTTLYQYLSMHPGIGMSREKETDFFLRADPAPAALAAYGAQFDHSRPVHGEVCPNYTKCTDFPGVPARIHRTCGPVRLIYVLRDPVARAESQYRHMFASGEITVAPADLPGTRQLRHIMDASFYHRQILAYLEVFAADSIQVIDFDALVRAPQATMDRIYDHIGLPSHPIPESGTYNSSEEMSRIPAPLLRLARAPLGRRILRPLDRGARDALRRAMAFGRIRKAPPFPENLRAQMRAAVAEDARMLRQHTGMAFAHWSV